MQQRDLVQAQIERLHAHMEQQGSSAAGAAAAAPPAVTTPLNGAGGGNARRPAVAAAAAAAAPGPSSSADGLAPSLPQQNDTAVMPLVHVSASVVLPLRMLTSMTLSGWASQWIVCQHFNRIPL